MGQLFAVFSTRRYRAWTYGQTGREALSRGASRCATEGCAMGVVMRCEVRVGAFVSVSVAPRPGLPPRQHRCPSVAPRRPFRRPPSPPVAKQAHREHLPALCVYGCGAPLADIGNWRTATPNLARRTCPPVRHFGENPFSYREARWLAQVVSILGAGVRGVWRRCGKWVGTCATGGRRSPICGAG